MSAATSPAAEAHAIAIRVERGAYMPGAGHRAHCSCGWGSDCYSQLSDTERAIEVHLRRAARSDFEALITRSSIGAALADVKARGIAAHLADLERAARRRRRRLVKKIDATFDKIDACVARPGNADASFLRGFALALATIWRCHHDGQMVECLLRENGLALADFRGLDVDVDYEAIRQALASRRRS